MFEATEEIEDFADDRPWVPKGPVERLEGPGRGGGLVKLEVIRCSMKLKKMGNLGDLDVWWVRDTLRLVLMVF